MREWLEAQLAAGLPALAGSTVAGTIAVKQEMVNELLADWLAQTSPASVGTPTLDLSRMKAMVKEAKLRAEPGTLLIDFRIAV